MSSKRKPIPKEQEKLFENLNSLEREGHELVIKIDDTLKKIREYKNKELVSQHKEGKKIHLGSSHTDEVVKNE